MPGQPQRLFSTGLRRRRGGSEEASGEDAGRAGAAGNKEEGEADEVAPPAPILTGGVNSYEAGEHEVASKPLLSPSTPALAQEAKRLRTIKGMLIVYSLLLCISFGLTIVSDYSRLVPRMIQISLGLHVLATVFFLLVVPLTHLSGTWYHKKWRFFQPFAGGIRFILFQSLSWFFYALCLILGAYCVIFWSYVAKQAFGFLTYFGVLGLVSQVLMVSSLFVFQRPGRDGISTPIITRRPARQGSSAVKAVAAAMTQMDDTMRHVFYHHNMLLAIAAVALALVAEFYWHWASDVAHSPILARGAGLLSILLFVMVLFNTYGVGGQWAHRKTKQWRFWQPFFGGFKFVVLQALSWTFFTLSLIIEIAFIISTFAVGFELFVGAAVVAGVFFIVSEVLMIVSLSFFLPSEKPSHLFSLKSVAVSDESLEQFRLITVVTFLSNMQYIAFLLPIVPFLVTGVPVSMAGSHWFAFFVCLTGWLVVNTYVKTMSAKRQGKRKGIKDILTYLVLSAVWSMPGVLCCLNRNSPTFPGWVFCSGFYYLYSSLTFHGRPEFTGRRELNEDLELFGLSLYSILEGIDKYFKGQILCAQPLDPKGTYVFAFHPHGVQPFTVVWLQLSRAWREQFKGLRFSVMTASVMHFVPIMRDLLQWTGGREVSRESIMATLGAKRSILLIPGGQQEMMASRSNTDEIHVLTRHTGFIRIALQSGMPLVPVLSFGEQEVMDFVRWPRVQNFFISRVGLPVPFFPYGLFGFPIPRPVPVTVVFGKPIPVTKIEEPSKEEVARVAKIYFDQLREVFDTFKEKAGCPDHRLVFF